MLALVSGAGLIQAQTATSEPTAPAAPSKDEVVVLEEFQVKGIRGSAMKAIELKKNNIQFTDSIVSEDIGKFPDNNIVESMQRMTGVQVTDYGAGNITGVTIRGLPDVTTLLNGRNIFTASGLSISLSDVPASLLSRVDVMKTRSAAQIETGIAGIIDIQTHRPFDFAGRKVSAAVKATYREQGGKFDPNLSVLVSNNWKFGSEGKIGFLVNASYLTATYRDQSVTAGAMVPFQTGTPSAGYGAFERLFPTPGRGGDGWWQPIASEVTIWTGGLDNGLPSAWGSTMKINGVNVPYILSRDAIFQNDTEGQTRRPAVNLSFQIAPNKKSEYTFEVFYDGYRNENYSNLLFSFADAWWANNPGGNITYYPGTNIVKSRGYVGDVFSFTSGDFNIGKTDSYQYSAAGKWNFTPSFQLKSELVAQTSKFDHSFFAMRGNKNTRRDLFVDFNTGDGTPSWGHTGTNLDNADANQWDIGHVWDNGEKNKGGALTFTTDGSLEVNWGVIKRLKFGVRYDARDASEAFRRQEGDPVNLTNVNLAAHPELIYRNSGFFDGRANIPTTWAAPNGYYTRDNTDKIRGYYGLTTSPKLRLYDNFSVDEITKAVYMQVDEFRADLGGHKLTGQFGLRYVTIDTDVSYTTYTDQTKNVFVANSIRSVSGSVSKVLPSAALNFEITKNFIARLGYGETIRRPGFGDLNPLINYQRDVTNLGLGTASTGNPNLKETTSKNFDFALEYYFNESSMINVAVFERKIDGFVVGLRRQVTYTDNIGPYNYMLSELKNASNGDLKGIEIGGKCFPKAFRGFGFEGSFTHLKSSQDIPMTNNAGLITGYRNDEFFLVSPNSYSVTLAYERKKFSARTSYAWRSAFHHHNEAPLFANPLAVYNRAERSLTAQLSYNVTENMSINLEGTNLTDDVQHSYYGKNGSTTSNFGSWIVGRTFSAGCRYSF